MKSKIFQYTILTGILSTSLMAQQAPIASGSDEKTERRDNLISINNRFSNLPLETRKKYFGMKQDAFRYFGNKRTFESMMKLYEMMEIFNEDPQVYNLLGSIHIEFRNFDRAREVFTKALNISAGDVMILFNLAEIEFCTSNWEDSLKRFEQLESETKGGSSTELEKLIKLKMMLCKLALSNPDNKQVNATKKATYLAEAKKSANLYGYLDDSPYYYYAQAALEFHEDNPDKANEWLRKASNVFGFNSPTISSWNDTFVEFGYLSSHYGIEEEKEDSNPLIE